LLASETGIDPLLVRAGAITYVYDYGDDWMHEIEVLEEVTLTNPEIPEVLRHKGPGPIEDSGGVDGFREVHEAIKDKAHPEHEEWLLWAKSQNYKERDPKKAINRTLKKICRGKGPVTETNDPTVDMEKQNAEADTGSGCESRTKQLPKPASVTRTCTGPAS